MQHSAIFKNPERIHQSFLADFEKRCIIRIAETLPRWVNSDHLTILGFVGMVLTGLSYWASKWNPYFLLFANFSLSVNWFGDSLDGTLARVRNQQRPRYGFYVDHIIDAFGILCLTGGMALSGLISPWIAAGVTIVYYLLSIEIALATVSFGKFRLSFGLFGPTELRILLAIGNLVLLFHPMVRIFGNEFKLFDVSGVITIAGLLVVVVHSTIKNTLTLYKEESIL